jgi:hypothetical protein
MSVGPSSSGPAPVDQRKQKFKVKTQSAIARKSRRDPKHLSQKWSEKLAKNSWNGKPNKIRLMKNPQVFLHKFRQVFHELSCGFVGIFFTSGATLTFSRKIRGEKSCSNFNLWPSPC